MTRKKCLIVSRNLPPLQGGIERLMAQVVVALAAEYDCYVIGPRGCRALLPPGVHSREIAPFVPWFLLRASLQVAAWRVRHVFELAVAGNGLVAPIAALGSRAWIAFVHGLDLVAPYRVYQAYFVPWLGRAAAIVANSGPTRELALSKGVSAARAHVLHPGVAAPRRPTPGFRSRFGLGDGPLLLSVGRLVPRKGYVEFVERALPTILERFPNARYVIVGADAPRAANRVAGMRERIEAAARDAGVARSVSLLGALEDADLAAAYDEADVFVFPSLGRVGDVEGFGMVLLEAAAHGTPAVAFATGGVIEAVAPESGILVTDGDLAGFAAAVIRLLSGEQGAVTEAGCRRHASEHGWPQFEDRVRAIARDVAGR